MKFYMIINFHNNVYDNGAYVYLEMSKLIGKRLFHVTQSYVILFINFFKGTLHKSRPNIHQSYYNQTGNNNSSIV